MLVFVLNFHGEPLMPCSPRRARLLLKEGKAKVIRKNPFTIKLLYGSSGYRQKVIASVDAGSKQIGCAVFASLTDAWLVSIRLCLLNPSRWAYGTTLLIIR